MKKSIRLNSVRIVLLCFVALWLALGYDYFIRLRSVPEIFQYIPKQSDLVFYTNRVDSLWNKANPHFNRIFKDKAKQEKRSEMRQAIETLKKDLKEHDVPIDDLTSLTKYGIDIKGRIAFGGTVNEKNPQFVLVLPVIDADKFATSLARLLENDVQPDEPLHTSSGKYELKHYATDPDLYLLLPAKNHILLSNNKNALVQALQDMQGNLDYHRNDDNSRFNLSSLTSEFQREEISILACWRFTKNRLLHQVALGLALSSQRISIALRVAMDTNTFRVFNDLATPVHGKGIIVGSVNSRTGLMAAVRDPALSSYLKFIRSIGNSKIRKDMANFFGGILLEIEQSNSTSEVKVSVVGYEAGLPEVVVGITGERNDLESLRFNVQRKKRLERDKTILRNVISEMLPGDEKEIKYPIEAVIKHGNLIQTRQSLWQRYSLLDGDIIESIMYPDDFGIDTGYIFDEGGFRCTYLLPAVNQNDIRWRINQKELENLDKKVLLDDRYRLCTTIEDDILWIGTDGHILRSYLWNDKILLADSEKFPHHRYKMRLYLNINRIITEGLLNPESFINDLFDQALMDFGDYNKIVVDVYPSISGDDIWIRGEITDEK
jgi:hypothetical protein